MNEERMRAWAGVAVAVLSIGCGGPRSLPSAEPGASVTHPGSWVDAEAASEALIDRVIGTAHPMLIEAVSENGRWVAFCQAREDTDGDGSIGIDFGYHGDALGDRLEPFIDIDGTELPIDAFVDASKGGRYVVVVRDERVELLDTIEGTRTVLAASSQDDPNPMGGYRMAAFDEAGERLLYVRGPAVIRKKPRRNDAPWSASVIVRELASGQEHAIDAGYGVIWHAWFDPGGEHVWAAVVDRDTDRDRKLQIPLVHTSLSPRGCRGPVMSWSTGRRRGDQPTIMLAERDATEFRAEPGAIGMVAGVIVAREGDGSLVARSSEQTVEVAPASCEGTIVYADADSGRIAFVCEGRVVLHDSTVWVPLYLFEDDKTTNTGVFISAGSDDRFDTRRRLWIVRGERTYDIEVGELIPLGSIVDEEIELATHGDTVVILPANKVPYLRDRSGERQTLGVTLGHGPGSYRLSWWAVGSRLAVPLEDGRAAVFDLDGPTLVGHVPSIGLGMAPGGEILIPQREERRSIWGPLRWYEPR